MRFIARDSTDSTMLDARRAIARGPLPDLTVFSAGEQTGGIGRFGRAWSSPKGGLWMTVMMPLEQDQLSKILEGLGLRVGVAVLDTLERACRTLAAGMGASDSGPSGPSPRLTLKWPNDVLLNGRKVAGVLVETAHAGGVPHALIGVGVNANFPARDLPADLRDRATSILAELGVTADLARLRDDLARAVFNAVARQGLPYDTLARARDVLAGVGQTARVTFDTALEPVEGTLLGLSDRGAPILMTLRGEVELPPGVELAHLSPPRDSGADEPR